MTRSIKRCVLLLLATFTYRDTSSAAIPEGAHEIMRDTEIVGFENNVPVYLDRITLEANVVDLSDIYTVLSSRGIGINHFYDY